MVDTKNTTTIRVNRQFKSWLDTHGRFGDRYEDIIIRLIGEDIYKASGDRQTKTYDKQDIDSLKTKKRRSVKTSQEGKE